MVKLWINFEVEMPKTPFFTGFEAVLNFRSRSPLRSGPRKTKVPRTLCAVSRSFLLEAEILYFGPVFAVVYNQKDGAYVINGTLGANGTATFQGFKLRPASTITICK